MTVKERLRNCEQCVASARAPLAAVARLRSVRVSWSRAKCGTQVSREGDDEGHPVARSVDPPEKQKLHLVLTTRQIAELDQVARAAGIGVSELLRRLLDGWVERRRKAAS